MVDAVAAAWARGKEKDARKIREAQITADAHVQAAALAAQTAMYGADKTAEFHKDYNKLLADYYTGMIGYHNRGLDIQQGTYQQQQNSLNEMLRAAGGGGAPAPATTPPGSGGAIPSNVKDAIAFGQSLGAFNRYGQRFDASDKTASAFGNKPTTTPGYGTSTPVLDVLYNPKRTKGVY